MNARIRNMVFSELSFWIVFCLIGLYFIYPIRKSVRFGMDLVGGTYLTLEVHTEEAVNNELVETMQSVSDMLKKESKQQPTAKTVEHESIVLQFDTPQAAQDASLEITKNFKNIPLQVAAKDKTVTLNFTDAYVKQIKSDALERNIEVLRTRMRSAIEEIPISSQGEKNIIIELPGAINSQEAKARIGTSAKLEFRLVEKFGRSKEDILFEYDGELPAGKEILPGERKNEFYLVDKYAEVTGKMLKEARRAEGEQFQPVVQFRLNDVGAEKFHQLTSKHYGRQLAIVLDGVVITAPNINEPIPSGSGVISGNFTRDTAKELALLLTSGSYVARVTFGEERQIGPSLGQESRQQGLISCLVGLALLFAFSVYFYSLAGVFAFLALLYNLFLILIGLAWLHATLTLPGIAGMVLTVGMAIDASILIYERIKEELAKGVPIEKAVNLGFSGAMKVILDANITTFIVGVVLYYFGTGPIQGFAVTMMLGIIATLITGLFFLRSLFTFVLKNFRIQNLKI